MNALAYIGPGNGFLFSGPGPYLLLGLGLLVAWLVVRIARGQPLVEFRDKQVRWWERQRRLGFVGFVVVRGMLLFGSTAMLVSQVLEWWWSADGSFGEHWLRSLIQWALTGAAWGVVMWHIYEQAYSDRSRDHAG